MRHMWNGPLGKCFLQATSHGNGAVICPAFQRGLEPLASMKSAMRGADHLNALEAHCLIRPAPHRDFVPWDHRLFRAPCLCRLPHRSVRGSAFGSSARCAICRLETPICPALGQERPDDPGHLVGKRDGHHLIRTPRQKSA